MFAAFLKIRLFVTCKSAIIKWKIYFVWDKITLTIEIPPCIAIIYNTIYLSTIESELELKLELSELRRNKRIKKTW